MSTVAVSSDQYRQTVVFDITLSELIRRLRLRHDLRAYMEAPPTVEEAALASLPSDWGDLADDTDWELEWPEDR